MAEIVDTDTLDAVAPGPVASDAHVEPDRGRSHGLRVRDLVVRYAAATGGGEITAVDGVSLDVAPGEVVALLGPSGCGKSSLLRAVAGLEPLVGGAITWAEQDLAGVEVHRRGFGLMFQDGQLFPHRDVGGNVEFGLRMAHLPRAERARRVRELLDVVGLTGYEHRPVATLSGGEQQRVALARALAPAPRLLLLDEPLSALDRTLRERLADDLRAALTATGTTALLVTHDHDEAFTIADRVAVMSAGRLLQVDEPGTLWRRPVSREVAAFLGYEAFVDLDSPAGAAIRAALPGQARPGQALPGPALPGACPPAPRQPGAVAALAEGALVLAADGGHRGTLRSVAFRRGSTELTVDVPGVGRVTVLAPPGPGLRPGAEVRLRLDPSRLTVIPPPDPEAVTRAEG